MPGPESRGIFAVLPIDKDHCDFDGYSLTTNGEVYQTRSDYFNLTLGPEDIDIGDSVQRGLRSLSYDQGAYLVDPGHSEESEHALHHFHRLVHLSLATD